MSDGVPHGQTIIVVGGGIAGVATALEVAETGYDETVQCPNV